MILLQLFIQIAASALMSNLRKRNNLHPWLIFVLAEAAETLKATRTEISFAGQCYQTVLWGSGVRKKEDASWLSRRIELNGFLESGNDSGSSCYYFVCVYMSWQRCKHFLAQFHAAYQWKNVSFAHILALGQIPLCLSELFLEKDSRGGGGEYNVG